MLSEYEKIYAVFDYYDGVLTGIADFKGIPHYFARSFNKNQDEYESDHFFLKPIDEKTLQLAMEDWAIWERWYTSKSPIDTHPALPKDRERHEEIEKILAERLTIDTETAIEAQGDIQPDHSDVEFDPATNPFAKLQVKWKLISEEQNRTK